MILFNTNHSFINTQLKGSKVWLFEFYGISNFVGYLTPESIFM